MTHTDTATLDLVISKVRKMWRLAHDASTTDGERRNAEAKALALMAEHRLTETMIDLGYEDVLGDFDYERLTGRNARLTIDIVDTVARAYDCRVYWQGYGLVYYVKIFGFKSDVDKVKAIASMLTLDAWAQAQNEKGDNMASTKAMRRSFVAGYRAAIEARLREAKLLAVQEVVDQRRGEVEGNLDQYEDDLLALMVNEDMEYDDAIETLIMQRAAGASLVLVERGKQVESEYCKKRMRHAPGTSVRGGSAFVRGQEAGRSASMSNRGHVGGATKALAS
jgi:hypothetical protein